MATGPGKKDRDSYLRPAEREMSTSTSTPFRVVSDEFLKEGVATGLESPRKKALKKVTLIIPCYNEAEGIGSVIRGVPHKKLEEAGFALDILVIDNGSTDNTAEIARAQGARVIKEPKKGKGYAIKTALYAIKSDCDYVVMIDGDDTYKTSEILRLLEPLESGFCDVVLGSRLAGRMSHNAMKGLHRLGNWIFSVLVRNFYKVNITDTLTGFFAWRYDVVEKMRPYLASAGFAVEMEMITTMAHLGYEIYSVPITYEPRMGESSLKPFRDGRRILAMFTKRLFWRPRQANRVAFVSDAVYPFHKGGKERHLHEVSRRLARDGRDVHIYTMKWWDGDDEIEINGVYFHAISKLYPLYEGERRSIKEGILFALACLKMLRRSYDIVNVDNIPLFPLFTMRMVCWLKRKRMYVTWHEVWGREYWHEYLGGIRGLFGYLVEKIAMKLPNTFIAVSEHTTRRLRAEGVKREIKTVMNGVDFKPIFASPKSDESFDVIYAGRLISHKNVDLLLEAIAEVKKTHEQVNCAIIGNGPEKQPLLRLAGELGLVENVQFRDFLPRHEDLYSMIKASRMLVLPSVREGFGLIVAEANACNVPVITTNHEDNAARDLIIDGENGYLTGVDVNQLAARMNSILDGERQMTPLITFRREFSNLNWDRVAYDFEKVLC
jgi:glycosyltransferase involved in cell wall biosynthesis